MSSPLIHLICGSTGAGKSTYAKRLADELGAVRFSIDEWMTDLFWMDSPQPIDPTWAMARILRCEERIWSTARQIAGGGTACILDLGFTQREQRARIVALAADADLTVRLHFLDVSAEERWRRVQARNAGRGDSRHLTFDVTREMFDFVETLWQPPDEQEMTSCDGIAVVPAEIPSVINPAKTALNR